MSKSLKGRWEFGPRKVSYEVTCGSHWPPTAFIRIKNHSEEALCFDVSGAKLASGKSNMTFLGADTESDMLSDHEVLLPPNKRIAVALHFTDTSGTFSTMGELAVSLGVIASVDGELLHTIPEFLTVVGQVYSSP